MIILGGVSFNYPPFYYDSNIKATIQKFEYMYFFDFSSLHLQPSGNIFELHYWFDDQSHTMDAVVQNRCEKEFLGVVKAIASILNAEITIETEPFAEGGLRRWFRVLIKEENKKAPLTALLIMSLATNILIAPITTSINKVVEEVVESFLRDDEKNNLEKLKLRLEVEKLRQEINLEDSHTSDFNIINKRKSNFYETLQAYPKVKKVSFSIRSHTGKSFAEREVERTTFDEFILESDELEPEEIDNIIIEIISPVLKQGKYKWMGLYNGNPISFSMNSKEFKGRVQSGQIQFKNGAAINCALVIKRKLDNNGIEKEVGYEVIRVNSYFENDKPVETREGRLHRTRKGTVTPPQLDLFGGIEKRDTE
ncbi:hypothetical protein [Telluribacter sp.]|uniref:hypothetical protein n=1 Tax=Telluribacter sp. TaxID=1978767 RepID=UPI002E156897|nr:hypothetical protein [Telluribacter sp.]